MHTFGREKENGQKMMTKKLSYLQIYYNREQTAYKTTFGNYSLTNRKNCGYNNGGHSRIPEERRVSQKAHGCVRGNILYIASKDYHALTAACQIHMNRWQLNTQLVP